MLQVSHYGVWDTIQNLRCYVIQPAESESKEEETHTFPVPVFQGVSVGTDIAFFFLHYE